MRSRQMPTKWNAAVLCWIWHHRSFWLFKLCICYSFHLHHYSLTTTKPKTIISNTAASQVNVFFFLQTESTRLQNTSATAVKRPKQKQFFGWEPLTFDDADLYTKYNTHQPTTFHYLRGTLGMVFCSRRVWIWTERTMKLLRGNDGSKR